MSAPFARLLATYFDSAKPAVTGGTSKITHPAAPWRTVQSCHNSRVCVRQAKTAGLAPPVAGSGSRALSPNPDAAPRPLWAAPRMICCKLKPGGVTIMDIVDWLRSLGLGKYEAAFREKTMSENITVT